MRRFPGFGAMASGIGESTETGCCWALIVTRPYRLPKGEHRDRHALILRRASCAAYDGAIDLLKRPVQMSKAPFVGATADGETAKPFSPTTDPAQCSPHSQKLMDADRANRGAA